jgi:hypothetical protein
MKRTAIFVALTLTLLACGVRGQVTPNQVTPPNQAYSTWSTNCVISASTNAVFNGIEADFALYHTFQVYNTSTNTIGYSIARTLDNTNWYYGATNYLVGAGVAEATIAGKELDFKVLTFQTNAVGGINYLGGR